MAGVIDTYNIGFNVGGANREDLLNLISIISPTDTPFTTTAPRVEAEHVLHSWLTDALAATSSAGVIEGADFASSSFTTRPRLTNLCQIFRRTVKVSNTQRAVNPAGVDDEYKYQVMKMGREIQRNIETRIFSVSGACATGSSGAARVFKGLNDYLTKASKLGRHIRSWGDDVTSGASATASATSITEDRFNNMLQYIFHKGGSPDVIHVNAHGKRQINAFSGPTGMRRNIALADKTIIASVDLWDTEFGPMEITLNRWVRRSANTASSNTSMVGMAYAMERSINRLAILRPVKHVPLPPVGDSTRGMVIGELTLEMLNPTGNARAWGINNRF